jgi:hypothetical protein
MSETGEQGMTPQDPARQAGVGGGIIPDDQGEGEEQATEVAARQQGDGEDEGERGRSGSGEGS